jgi:septal ring factor EnvC (AmiA/AmiB activator)
MQKALFRRQIADLERQLKEAGKVRERLEAHINVGKEELDKITGELLSAEDVMLQVHKAVDQVEAQKYSKADTQLN